ncbi:MAG: hypothetical protein HFJ80_07285 [Clostridiales bacterium]|nr:hypothetical protein [Clostridiales bacterium]
MGAIHEDKRKKLKKMAQMLAVMGVRNNTELEDLHAGISPVSKTGDYTDVKVVTPYGEIGWNELSRINDKEMRSLMLSVERALEAVLCSYESLNHQQKEILLAITAKQRTYDREDRGSHN